MTATTSGGTVTYTVTWGDDDGTSGDREPRRPLPPSDPRSAALGACRAATALLTARWAGKQEVWRTSRGYSAPHEHRTHHRAGDPSRLRRVDRLDRRSEGLAPGQVTDAPCRRVVGHPHIAGRALPLRRHAHHARYAV